MVFKVPAAIGLDAKDLGLGFWCFRVVCVCVFVCVCAFVGLGLCHADVSKRFKQITCPDLCLPCCNVKPFGVRVWSAVRAVERFGAFVR